MTNRIPARGIMRIADVRTLTPDERAAWAARWPNFAPHELDSRDWSLRMHTGALDALQALRTRWGRALRITSAYRNPRHNASVGGVSRSRHVEGDAFDIVVRSAAEGRKLEALAREVGFTSIGRYPSRRFIHVDMRPGRGATWGRWT